MGTQGWQPAPAASPVAQLVEVWSDICGPNPNHLNPTFSPPGRMPHIQPTLWPLPLSPTPSRARTCFAALHRTQRAQRGSSRRVQTCSSSTSGCTSGPMAIMAVARDSSKWPVSTCTCNQRGEWGPGLHTYPYPANQIQLTGVEAKRRKRGGDMGHMERGGANV